MSDIRFDLLIIAMAAAGAVIAAVFLFMLAVPRNDDHHLHESLSEPGDMKARFLRTLASFRRRFSR